MCAADVKILSGRLHTAKKHKQVLLIVIEQFGLVENVDKTKYMMCFGNRIEDEIKIYRLLIVPL